MFCSIFCFGFCVLGRFTSFPLVPQVSGHSVYSLLVYVIYVYALLYLFGTYRFRFHRTTTLLVRTKKFDFTIHYIIAVTWKLLPKYCVFQLSQIYFFLCVFQKSILFKNISNPKPRNGNRKIASRCQD